MYTYLGADPISISPKDIRTELEYGAGLRLRPAQQIMVAAGIAGLLYFALKTKESPR